MRLFITLCLLITLFIATLPVAVAADSDAEGVLKKLQERYRALKTLRADVAISGSSGPNKTTFQFTGTTLLKRPDLWRIELQGRIEADWGGARKYLAVSDGKTSWKLNLLTNRYVQETVTQQNSEGKAFVISPLDPLSNLFFSGDLYPSGAYAPGNIHLLPAEKVNGIECGVLELVWSGRDTGRRFSFYISEDYTVYRIREQYFDAGGGSTLEVTLSKVQLDANIPARSFRFAPPKQAKESKQPLVRHYWFMGFMIGD